MEQTPALHARSGSRRSRLGAALAAPFVAVFAFLNAMTASVEGPMSRRAMLAAVREEKAESNPIKDIAIGFILIGLALLIALTFWPAITSAVATAQADANTTGSADTVIGLIPLVLAVALLLGSVAFLFRGFRAIGG